MKIFFGILAGTIGTAAIFSVTNITGLTCFLIPLYGFCSLMLGVYTGGAFRE